MPVDPKFVEIASQYMDPAELSRLKDMMSMSRKEYLNHVAVSNGIIEVVQALDAEMIWDIRPNAEDHFGIGHLRISNGAQNAETGRIAITLNRVILEPKAIEVVPGRSIDVDVRLEDAGFTDSMVSFDKPVACTVAFIDGYGREVLSCSRELTFVRSRRESMACAAILPSEASTDNRSLSLGILSVTAFRDGYSHISISVKHGTDEVLAHKISVEQGHSVNVPLIIPEISATADAGCDFIVSASCGDIEFFRNVVHLSSEKPRTSDPQEDAVPTKRIFGECRFQRVIDVHDSKDGDVKLGELNLVNSESEPQQVSISLTVGGAQVLFSNQTLSPSSESSTVLTCTALSLFKQEAYSVDACCKVVDSEGLPILCRSMTMDVLSQYDLDLNQLPTRTVEFINPLNADVKAFVDDRKGPLAKAMGSSYSVTGYQDPKMIVAQMQAVYEALHSYGMSYVSDTSTLESGFQRVRTPDKVLKDHTGNCIELSILFASIFESMGLEPVVVFPRGHAIVGVVTRTNIYDSGARPPEPSTQVLRMNVDKSRYFEAVFIESTMCPCDWASFPEAVKEARSTVSKETEYISRRGRYALVKKMRKDGVKTAFR